ncbi:hypothetical protein [Streptomyces sp. NRRL WC-3742]|uniref:hypothetical protein n=1 Tax=Streptomyces sp. NRRL WC-3742 TaxID=1463934 RepID=UPI0006905426|nr:hypothetical protein [Streptomyces sp. NRRL WC-3742]
MRIDERAVRAGAAWTAVAATLPYLTLKTLWLLGVPVGADDAAQLDKLFVPNVLSFGMDAIAVALALSFVRPWGRRVPAGLVAFPMWVATGLLGAILVAVPLSLLAGLVLGPEHAPERAPGVAGFSDWVTPLVYGGFSVQGLALITAFLLYARRRWAWLLRDRVGDLPGSPTLAVQRSLACAAAPLALAVATAHAYWAAGGKAGLPDSFSDYGSRGPQTMSAVMALMALAAPPALLALVFRLRPQGRLLRPVLAAWTGAGAMLGWGAWQLIMFGTTGTTVQDLRHATPGLLPLVECVQVATGLLILAAGAVALTERGALERGSTLGRGGAFGQGCEPAHAPAEEAVESAG